MAVPNGMKLLIRSVDDAIDVFNDPRGKDKRIFVIVNSVADATKIAKNVTDIESVNVANAGTLINQIQPPKQWFSQVSN